MNYSSTRDGHLKDNFLTAVLHGLAADGGLYVPAFFPEMIDAEKKLFFQANSCAEVGSILLKNFLEDLPEKILKKILDESLNFPMPLVQLDKNIYLLEVFHGPTLAFKDVGARCMARLLAFYLDNQQQKLAILVATSGDTGSAVAHGFYGLPRLRVFVLYPKGRISLQQEQQITTLGGNIFPLEIEGSFDDCQRLVKEVLQAQLLSQKSQQPFLFSTANSINIARLLPQMLHHAWGVVQLKKKFFQENPILCVPSGNFGNLVSAIYAQKCGVPISHFIAATNSHTVFSNYLATGQYLPQPSHQTVSNAMDVGAPSNLERLFAFYHHDHALIQQNITSFAISDAATLQTIRDVYQQYGYLADPHTAVGIRAAFDYVTQQKDHQTPIIVTATAHPAKFPAVIQQALGEDFPLPMPEQLQRALSAKKMSQILPADYAALCAVLKKT